MKTKSFFKSALAVLLLGASMSATAAYVPDPTLCNGITTSWDPMGRTFTVGNLKSGIKEPYCAWVTDPMWATGTYDDSLTPWSGITPGATSYKTARLNTKWGDPLKGGTNGTSNFFVAISGVLNDRKGAKSEDCNKTCDPGCLANPDACTGKAPTYCDNYDGKYNGSVIRAKGLQNCVDYNMYAIATADWSKWQSVNFVKDPSNPDVGVIDVKNLKFYESTENVYPFADGVMLFLNANDKGGGPSGQIKPGYCSTSYDLNDPANEDKTIPAVGISDISYVNGLDIYPNPAIAGQYVTVKGSFDADTKVAIYDATGKLVASSIVPVITSEGLAFEVPAQVSAINFLKISSSSASYSAKLSVVK